MSAPSSATGTGSPYRETTTSSPRPNGSSHQSNGASHTRAASVDVSEDVLDSDGRIDGATAERTLLAAEENVAGACLVDRAAYNKVDLPYWALSDPHLSKIWLAIVMLHHTGKPHDAEAVIAWLAARQELEVAGGRSYIEQLARETATADTVSAYAEYIRQHLADEATESEQSPATPQQAAKANGHAPEATPRVSKKSSGAQNVRAPALPLDWSALALKSPPERDWAIERWLGMGHVTLMAGAGGEGKTTIAQAVGSCLALRREYLDWPPRERRALFWACEDDEHELWRRQITIAKWLGVPLADFHGRLFVHSYNGQPVELAGLIEQRQLVPTPRMTELREQIGDYRAEVLILDNVARLFAGNENDRHQVTSFIAMLTGAAAPTNAAVLLIGHPGKNAGSEYSGSTAWEGAVRARWYLGRSLPGTNAEDEDAASADDGTRFLCRRKANYSDQDWCRLRYQNGVMIPEVRAETAGGQTDPGYAAEVVARAVRKLADMGEHGVASSNSPKFLPRLARDYKLLDRLTEKQFAATMRAMRSDGRLIMDVVGRYPNRNPREGLILPKEAP